MELFYYAAFLMAAVILPVVFSSNTYNDPSKDQFHIQTDEGPERYFKYQTLNGQYRKEKRLEDGTVVGTYGWVDADGVFRMRDYIADGAGYRIVKTKNVYVGRSRPINEALSIARKAPSEAGVAVGGVPARNRYSYNIPVSRPSYVPPPLNVEVSFNSVPSSTIQPPISTTASYLPPSSTPAPPVVSTTHSAYLPPSSTPAPVYIPSTSYLPPPSSTPEPEYLPPSSTPAPVYIPSSSPTPVYIPSSTPAPVYIPSSTPAPLYVPSTYVPPSVTPSPYYIPSTRTYYKPTAKPNYYNYLPSNTIAPPLHSNSIYSSDPQYEHYSNPYIFQNGPTYPVDKYGQSYNGLGNGYERQFPLYDGVSVTNDGFRYYIPKQYHEEQSHSDNQKSGSFGYIDPFGIRRVIYYNAGPDGFKHRKNNRYVGFDATPYDPRPY